MNESIRSREVDDRSLLVRLGGIAGLTTIAVHFFVNMILKSFPDEDLTIDQLRDYFQNESSNRAIVHGLRYFAIAGIVFMVAGLYLRTSRKRAVLGEGWGLIGLLGAALWIANLTVTNGIEMFAFVDFQSMSNEPDLFWLAFHMTRVLFSAEMIAWVIVTFGFSMSGLRLKTLPPWIAYAGLLLSTVGFASSITIVNVLRGGWTSALATVTAFGIILWFISASAYLVVKGDKV